VFNVIFSEPEILKHVSGERYLGDQGNLGDCEDNGGSSCENTQRFRDTSKQHLQD